jgi:alkylation response protein AidB-like acyl-CoA dehydrogenase
MHKGEYSNPVKYANERVQFHAYAEFGAIRSKLAEMAMN